MINCLGPPRFVQILAGLEAKGAEGLLDLEVLRLMTKLTEQLGKMKEQLAMGQIEARLEAAKSKLGQDLGEKVQELGRQEDIVTKEGMARGHQREDIGVLRALGA